jgi:hypothetical protein
MPSLTKTANGGQRIAVSPTTKLIAAHNFALDKTYIVERGILKYGYILMPEKVQDIRCEERVVRVDISSLS